MKRNADKSHLGRDGYHHGDLRRTLVRMAREQIAQNGAAAISLAALARLAGVSQPAPYRHFADRNALLEAVAMEGFEEFTAALNAAAATAGRGRALKAMALAYVAFGEANIELYRLMFASPHALQTRGGSPLETAGAEAFDLLREALAGTTPAERIDDEARLVWAQLHGLLMLRADGHLARPAAALVEVSSLCNR